MKRILQALSAVTAGLVSCQLHAAPLEIGAPIPAVTQQNQAGEDVDLAKAGAEGHTLVYFYPKADTPGCTKQACSLRDSYEKLTEKGIKIFGVSMDKVEAQKAFQEKYKLPFTLLADPDGKVVDAFGVPRTMGFAKRQAFLFKDGKLIWSDKNASTEEQAADVLKQLAAN